MQNTMLFLKERRGVEVVTFALPEPATTSSILAAYEKALRKTSKARLMLVTHLCHRTGLVNPVKEIIASPEGTEWIAFSTRRRQSVRCQLTSERSMRLRRISLHKWVGAPLGTGAVYIRKSRLADIDICLGNREDPAR